MPLRRLSGIQFILGIGMNLAFKAIALLASRRLNYGTIRLMPMDGMRFWTFFDSIEGLVKRDGWTSPETLDAAFGCFSELRNRGLAHLKGDERGHLRKTDSLGQKHRLTCERLGHSTPSG